VGPDDSAVVRTLQYTPAACRGRGGFILFFLSFYLRSSLIVLLFLVLDFTTEHLHFQLSSRNTSPSARRCPFASSGVPGSSLLT
jgi:hypothetical protein